MPSTKPLKIHQNNGEGSSDKRQTEPASHAISKTPWTLNYGSHATQPGHHLHSHLHRNHLICLNQYSGYTQALDSSCLKNASGVFNNDNCHQNAIVSLD